MSTNDHPLNVTTDHSLQSDRNPLTDDSGKDFGEDVFFAPATREEDGRLYGAEIIVLPDQCSRGDAIAILSKNIEQNQFGLPTHFIRSDLLPSLLTGSVAQDEVDSASVGLFYNEGYPTLASGTPFWNQLPHEPQSSHNLFQRYIDQAEEHGIRQLDLLSAQEGTGLEVLRQCYLEFYWSSRARAYDLFIVAAEERKRQLRTRKMESDHYTRAETLLATLETRFKDPEWIEELDAKEAIEAMDTLIKLMRLSVGLTGQYASSLPKDRLPDGASVQSIMEHITRGANLSQEGSDNFTAKLQALLSDEDSGMVLQEAILKISRTDMTSSQNHDATLGDHM